MTPVKLRAAATLRRWAERPIEMVREEFGAEPDAWQAETLKIFARRDQALRLALKACKGPGKTTILAWCILNFLATRPEPKVLCTSITDSNLKGNLWPELAKWMGRSAFFTSAFEWTATRISLRGEQGKNWYAEARAWPKQANADAQANALAGHHADYVMAVADESGGYPQAVMTTLEAIFSSCIEGKLLQAGNPTHTTGPLHRACTIDRALWHVVRITGDPESPMRSPRIRLDWAQQQIASYGRDNPWVMVNVLGEFPPSSINALLGVEEVERAMARHLRLDQYEWAQKRLGIDVARFGDDRTIIFPRQGLASFRPITMRGAMTTEIAAKAMVAGDRWRGREREAEYPLMLVDDTGHWGHGVIDNLRTAGIPVIGINYAGKATDPRFKNKRAEMWIKGSEAIRAGAALPPDDAMIPELTEPTYTFLNGVFVLEEKDQIKARLGRSPDLADAYMTTYAIEDLPGNLVAKLRGRQQVLHDGDPFNVR